MFLEKVKKLLNKPEKIEADLNLNNKIKEVFQNTLAPLDISIAPLIMEKIKAKTVSKGRLSYKLRYNLIPVTLAIFLIFALTGISFSPNSKNVSPPTFSVSLAPVETSPGVSNSSSQDIAKISSPPSPTINNSGTKTEEKNKIKNFFEKIWKFVLNLWQ